MKNVKPRIKVCTLYPIKRERFEKIIKNAKPGPASYDTSSVIRKTQWSPPKGGGGINYKKIEGTLRYIDNIIKNKKNIPGVGRYENLEKAFDRSFRYKSKKGRY
jgi:hypothetical protein